MVVIFIWPVVLYFGLSYTYDLLGLKDVGIWFYEGFFILWFIPIVWLSKISDREHDEMMKKIRERREY